MENKNVLIVEDNRLICWSLERLSSSHGLSVTSVKSSEEAISAVSRIPFRLAFLNVQRQGSDGLDLLHQIKKMSPETQVTVMTADGGGISRAKALLAGAIHFIEKPFSVAEVRKIFDSVFDTPLEKRGN